MYPEQNAVSCGANERLFLLTEPIKIIRLKNIEIINIKKIYLIYHSKDIKDYHYQLQYLNNLPILK